MENFIKESKSDFDFSAVSSHNRIVNANRVQVHALAYNIFNWFRRLVLSPKKRKQRIDTVRLKLLKIAAKVVHSARYSGSVVKQKIQAFYNEPISVAELGRCPR